MENLRLVFAPHFERNPYQSQLANGLELLGVETEGTNFSNTSVTELILRKKVDILHLHWPAYFFIKSRKWKSLLALIHLLTMFYLFKVLGTKIVWTVHNLKDHENPFPQLDQKCNAMVSQLADAIIVHCKAAKHQVIEMYGLSNQQEKVFVISHGNYIDCYKNKISQADARGILGIDNSKPTFLFFGKIRLYKGVLELIEVFEQLDNDQVQLIIAGQPGDDDLVKSIHQGASGMDNIKLELAFISEDEIQVYMNACDVVVFPYRDILTSGAIVLAMSFGKACIAPRLGCISEVLDGRGGFVYDSGNQNGLLEAMRKAVSEKSNLSNMGNYNFSLAQKLNWADIADQTLDVYQHCLKSI